jgi:hypothetical protein
VQVGVGVAVVEVVVGLIVGVGVSVGLLVVVRKELSGTSALASSTPAIDKAYSTLQRLSDTRIGGMKCS